MPIRRKSSENKKYLEKIGQGLLFGHDNLVFKTVNHPKKQRLVNISKKFGLKLLVKKKLLNLEIINIY